MQLSSHKGSYLAFYKAHLNQGFNGDVTSFHFQWIVVLILHI